MLPTDGNKSTVVSSSFICNPHSEVKKSFVVFRKFYRGNKVYKILELTLSAT